MVLIFVFFSLILFSFQLDLCDFSTYGGLSLDDAQKCFETMGIDTTNLDDVYDNLIKYAKLSELKDIYKDPPNPYNDLKLDLEEEIRKAKEKIKISDYEYNSVFNLIDIYNGLKNPQFRYIPPLCYYETHYVLPYTIHPVIENGNTVFKFVQSDEIIVNIYNNMCQREYIICGNNLSNIDKALNHNIGKIDGIPVMDYIKEIAKDLPYSKDLGTNINMLLKRHFTDRVLAFSNFPERSSVLFEVANGASDPLFVEIPYIFINSGVKSSEGIKYQCKMPYKGDLTSYENIFGLLRKSEYSDNIKGNRNIESHGKTSMYSDTSRYLPSTHPIEYLYEEELIYDFSTYYDPTEDRAIGVIILKTFDISGEIWALIGHIKQYLGALDKLIIDVRGNHGGNIDIANYVPSWINYKMSGLNTIMTRKLIDKYSTALLDSNELGRIVYDPIDHSNLFHISSYFDKVETFNFTDTTVDPPKIIQRNFTNPFSLSTGDYHLGGNIYEPLKSGGYYEKIFELSRADVIILSDGDCLGECSVFLHNIKEMRGAIVVTVGGVKTETEEIIPGYGESQGTSMISNDEVMIAVNEIIRQCPYINELPGRMPEYIRTTIPWYSFFSTYNDTNPISFEEPRGDFNLLYYSKSRTGDDPREDYPSILDPLFKLLDDHSNYPDEQKEIDIGFSETCKNTEKEVFGALWDSNKLNYSGSCKLMYCNLGYNMDGESGQCIKTRGILDNYVFIEDINRYYVPREEVDSKYIPREVVEDGYISLEEMKKQTVPIAGAISAIVLFFLTLAALIVVVLLYVMQKRRMNWNKGKSNPINISGTITG